MVLPEMISFAAHQGDTKAIEEWFASGTRDPDETGSWMGCKTLLYAAAEGGHCDTMRVILAHGADVNCYAGYNGTALHRATQKSEFDAAVLLLDHGAQIDCRENSCSDDDYQGCTPLIDAIMDNGYSRVIGMERTDLCTMIRLLLSRGADLACEGGEHGSAESTARYFNEPEAEDLLADVRLAGGWKPYVLVPRRRLLALRVLCDEGRASTDDDLLARVFGAAPPSPSPKRARLAATTIPACYRRKIVWRILEYWRSDRDSRY